MAKADQRATPQADHGATRRAGQRAGSIRRPTGAVAHPSCDSALTILPTSLRHIEVGT
jgi:hypothetical protein